jgi:cytidyltransferase-like protein
VHLATPRHLPPCQARPLKLIVKKMKKQTFGSIIGLKQEFAERYILLHRHPFPGVLQRIHRSNISDYSIFLKDGILFSHMVYSGEEYDADMQAIAGDRITQEWWKLTDPMQQPFEGRKEGEWWAGLTLWRELISDEMHNIAPPLRFAFTAPVHRERAASAPEESDLHPAANKCGTIKIFKNAYDYFFYIETNKAAAVQSVLAALTDQLGLPSAPAEMTEVFHTSQEETAGQIATKVFVTGCFDLLHSGHIAFLNEAAEYGDLYVCIGSDANVHHLKGRYPVNSQDERKYVIDALQCVHECRVNSGWGIMDFEKELRDILPDIFIVNEDGHTPSKQALCKEMGIDYKILKRIPHENLPVRSTTALRTECTIPFRIDLAGGWLDQPAVSRFYPGPVLTISIEPTIEFNERSGMASSTRRKAIELWGNEIPHGNNEQLARILFSYENPPGTHEVSGSQDSLGIVCPGLNRHDYNNHYWPEKVTSIEDEGVLTWLEKSLYLVTLGPRVNSYDVLAHTKMSTDSARALAQAATDCWNAILNKDIRAFGNAFQRSFEAQIAMFPDMADDTIFKTIAQYRDQALGWKLSGAGGGGYLIMVSHAPIEGAMQIKIRRRNNF